MPLTLNIFVLHWPLTFQNFEDEKLNELIHEYKEEMFGCSREIDPDSPLMVCDHIPSNEIEMRFQQDAQVSFVVKAVSALTAAFRLVQLDHCHEANVEAAEAAASGRNVSTGSGNGGLTSCLQTVNPDLHEDILTNLRKLSFTSMGANPSEVKGTQHHFTRNGRLVANKQLVFQIDEAIGMDSVSSVSHLAAKF